MKKLFALGSLILIVSMGLASAQGGPPGGGRGGMRMDTGQMQQRFEQRRKETRDKMVKELKLTPAQVKKYDEIQNHAMAKMKKIFADAKGTRPDFGKFRAINEESNTEIMKVLKPDQQAKYKKLRDEMRQRMRPGGAGGGRGGPGGPGGPGGRPGGA